MQERTISHRALFAVVYTTSVSSVYFALGVVAHRGERADAAGLPGRRHLLPAHRHDLRRGGQPAPGAGRLGRVRAPRVQRADQLHRRLGDRARLHDPRRRHRADGAELPGRVLGADRPRRTRDRRRARRDRVRRRRQPDRGQRAPAAPARSSSPAVDLVDPGQRDRARAACSSSTPITSRTTIHLGTAPTVSNLAVRAADRRDRLHRPRGGREPGRRGPRDPAGRAPPDRTRRGGDRARSTSASRSSASVCCRSTTA